ncbi:hypothetical protein [Mycobacterium marinum]|uniref:hypothetical protein n=1 Tax=Mycobacterium marinum TaxID=1781 RepID=UPI0035619F8F
MGSLETHEFMSLVAAASLAPSADNRREFRFEQSQDLIRVWGDSNFTTAPRHRVTLSLIAIGAAAENMRLRAGRLGLGLKVNWFPDSAAPSLVAEIEFQRLLEASIDPIEVMLAQRRTNRRMVFRGPTFLQEELRELAEEVDGIDGVELHWFDSPPARKQILRLVRIAETDRFRSQDLHDELFSALNFDVGWRRSTGEGLPPGSLEIEPMMRPLFKSLRKWDVVRRLNKVGVHHALGLRAAYAPCRLAPHMGALTTSLDVQAGALAAGAAFQRIWLRTTLLGAELQPFAATALYSLPVFEWGSPNVRAALAKGWQGLTPGRKPMMVFRIGHAPAPSVRATRPPIDDYYYVPSEST